MRRAKPTAQRPLWMSLKARIEAVIYVAEEPVTLAQLTALFREEALANRAVRVTPVADPEAPTEDSLAPGAELAGTEQEIGAADVDSAGVAPEPAATESLAPEVPPIPSGKEEPPPAAADPIAELADSPVTDSFPEGASASVQAPATAEMREAPAAGSEGSAGDETPAAAVVDEKKAARAQDREARDEIRRVVDELIADYAAADRGVEIREVAGGFRMGTRAEYHDAVRAFVKSLKPPMKLSRQALETLAVIAYKQPVTAPEIGEIRGVDSSGILGSLIARKLITTAGRKQVIGRPILYKTTREFLLSFGLRDLGELPSLEEFEKMATELAETEEEAAAIAPSEAELPFSQNDAAEIEDAIAAENGEEIPVQTANSGDSEERGTPVGDPRPEEPQPPIGEPPAESEPAPTSEHDVRDSRS